MAGWLLEIPMDPVPCPRPRLTKTGKVYYPKRYSAWKAKAAKMIAAVLMGMTFPRPLKGPLKLDLVIAPTRPRTTKLDYPKPDIDNYSKAIMDACNGLVWEDDEQVISLQASKAWAPIGDPGHIYLTVAPLTQP